MKAWRLPLPETAVLPPKQRSIRLTIDAVRDFFSEWSDSIAGRSTSLRIDDRPVLSILNIGDFSRMYGDDGLYFLLQLGRSVVRTRLGSDPYFVGVCATADVRNAALGNYLPLDALTGYALLPDWDGPPIQHYERVIDRRVREWYELQSLLDKPFLPVVCAGWDATVRGERVHDLRAVHGFPWRPIVTGVTARLFGRFLDNAVAFNDQYHPDYPYVFIHAWNEWTEGSVIEPSDRFGSAFLAEIRTRARPGRALSSDHGAYRSSRQR